MSYIFVALTYRMTERHLADITLAVDLILDRSVASFNMHALSHLLNNVVAVSIHKRRIRHTVKPIFLIKRNNANFIKAK